jgi:hypothetical protein
VSHARTLYEGGSQPTQTENSTAAQKKADSIWKTELSKEEQYCTSILSKLIMTPPFVPQGISLTWFTTMESMNTFLNEKD